MEQPRQSSVSSGCLSPDPELIRCTRSQVSEDEGGRVTLRGSLGECSKRRVLAEELVLEQENVAVLVAAGQVPTERDGVLGHADDCQMGHVFGNYEKQMNTFPTMIRNKNIIEIYT